MFKSSEDIPSVPKNINEKLKAQSNGFLQLFFFIILCVYQ
jgi:hypothetical protein